MRGRTLARWALGLLVVAGILATVRIRPAVLADLPARVAALGYWGPVAMAGLYALLVVALVPGVLLTLASGALFGVVLGTAVVFVGATGGAALAFLIARYVARDAVGRLVARYPRLTTLDRAIGEDGLQVVLLLRLSPLFPFVLLNYALGLTRVRFREFLLASVGMLPLIILYVYLGQLAGDLVLVAGVGRTRGPVEYGVLAGGLVVTALVTLRLGQLARRALATRGAGPGTPSGPGATAG